MSDLANAPIDVVACILQRCDLKELGVCSQVCKLWQRAGKRYDVCVMALRNSFCCPSVMELFLGSLQLDNEVVSNLCRSFRFEKGDADEDEEMEDSMYTHACRDGKATGNHRFPRVVLFEQMMLKPSVLRGMLSYGFEKPSRVQTVAIFLLAKVILLHG
jgi:hypothetical protein